MKAYITIGLLCCFAFSCQKDDKATGELDNKLEEVLLAASGGVGKPFFELPNSDDFDKIPQDPKNPLTVEKIALGKLLFHETATGIEPMKPENKRTYSCASCHFASAGFQAGRHQGIGEGGLGFGKNGEARSRWLDYTEEDLDVQPIRSPAALNTAYQTLMLWNGQFGANGANTGLDYAFVPGTPKETNNLGYDGVETQAIAGLKVHRLGVDENLLNMGYRAMFDAAFPDFPIDKRYSRETAGLAIAAFERILMANEAPFQQWLKGKSNAMNNQEKEGAILFFGKAGCVDCHTGPALNAMEFYALGMKDLHECLEATFKTPKTPDLGRGGFTFQAADNFKFKVPQLYNLRNSLFYGHGASFRNLDEVVEYKNKGVPENPNVPTSQLTPQFKPLGLSTNEVESIVAFLKYGLSDQNLVRYQPEKLLSGNCFPVGDPLSLVHLGCK